MDEIRTLLFDLETLNLKADLSPILCVGYKFLGEEKVHSLSIWDDDLKVGGRFSRADKKLCKKFAKVCETADLLCAHYGQRFDRPFVNARMLIHNIIPIDKQVRLVDTWRLARDNLALTSNRLKNLGKALGCRNQKTDSGGWDTWMDAITGDKKARNRLIQYCKNDVFALEDVYKKLLPFSPAYASYSAITGKPVCPRCGSEKSESRGYRVTSAVVYQRRVCGKCKRYFQINKHGQSR